MDRLDIRAWDETEERYLSMGELVKKPRLGRILLEPTSEGYVLERYTELQDANNYPIYERDILFRLDNRFYFVGYDALNGFMAVDIHGEEEPLRDNFLSCIVISNLNVDSVENLAMEYFIEFLDQLTEEDFK